MTQPTLDTAVASQHATELESGARFPFGENWKDYLSSVDESRIQVAIASLQSLLKVDSLRGRSFLDAGSGSGIFSLAALRLGATVTSFDYDPSSVGCTLEMRKRYAVDSPQWRVLHGSVLDAAFLTSLGEFDVVYSWGVLHHTGAMWEALHNIFANVRKGGLLFIALYNDQGVWSRRWLKIHQIYCSGLLGRTAMSSIFIPYWIVRHVLSDTVRGRAPWHTMATYKKNRGMSVWHDWHDWLGGYPFEVAKPETIILPIQDEGFKLRNLVTQYGTMGCVEYVFERQA